ncbi:MAG TPA: hypothetical protein VMH37_02910 [Candidatus Binataceae bacterium]|nr:hypothetical protein [Candidatus Binataceae bacterium]
MNWGSKLLVAFIAATFCGCASLMSSRKAEEETRAQRVYRMDTAHIYVSTGDLPPNAAHQVLGELKFSEPYSPDAADTHKIQQQLKDMALTRYGDQADAVIKAKADVESSGDDSTLLVTGEVVHFDSSADREMMHNMWDNLVVSPK